MLLVSAVKPRANFAYLWRELAYFYHDQNSSIYNHYLSTVIMVWWTEVVFNYQTVITVYVDWSDTDAFSFLVQLIFLHLISPLIS